MKFDQLLGNQDFIRTNFSRTEPKIMCSVNGALVLIEVID